MKLKLVLALMFVSTLVFAQKTSVTAINNIRMSDRYNFQQFPTDDLSTPGAGKTITLKKGILGVNTTNSAVRPYRVYIATVGTAELALVTGGTYTEAAGGTIIVTTANAHTAGYSVQSSTAGIQESINDACGIQSTASRNGPCNVVVPPTPPALGALGAQGYDIYDTIYWQARSGLLNGYGAKLNCRMRGPCLQVGDLTNSNDFPDSSVSGFSFRAPTNLTADPAFAGSLMVDQVRTSGTVTINTSAPHGLVTGDSVIQMFTDTKNYWGTVPSITVTSATQYTYTRGGGTVPDIAVHTGPGVVALSYVAIRDNGQHTTFNDISYESTFNSGGFNHFFDFWDDENALVTHFTNNGIRLNNNVNWTGSMFWSGGNQNLPIATTAMAPVLTVESANLTLNGANGVTFYDSNGVYINNTVIQAEGLWQVFASNATGGFSGVNITNLYSEPATSQNPLSPVRTPWPNLGSAGLIAGFHSQAGQPGYSVYGHHAPGGLITTSGAGSTTYVYMVIAKDTTALTQTSPFPVMYRKQNAAGSQVVSWPRMTNGNNTITYDVLRVPVPNGSMESAAGGFVGPYTGGCGGGAVGTCGSVAVGQAQGAGFIQTFTDDTNNVTTNYPTVPLGTWAGNVNFLPGDVVTVNSTVTMEVEAQTFGIGLNGSPASALLSCVLYGVSTTGGPTICMSTPTSSNNAVKNQPALMLFDGGVSGGGMSNSKGRLNFPMNTASVADKRDIITLVDSNFAKTKSTSSYRPLADANDSAIGVDAGSSGATVGVSFRAPVSLSNYIATISDGTSWLEQLTASLKTFKVPITTNSNVTMTGGTLNVSAAAKTIPWQVGNGVPSNGNCTIDGQVYFQSDSVNLGQQLWFCKTNVWTLMTGGGGGGGTWNTISSPGGNQSLSMGNFSSTWTGGTALTNPILTITDTAGDTYTGNLMQITVPATSTAAGLGVTVPGTGGAAATFQAGANGTAINVPFGQGNTFFNRNISTSSNAPTTGCSVCFGSTDRIVYWNGSLAAAMNLAGGGGAGPAHIGDTPGIDIAGTLTSRTAGQGLTFVPLANTGNGAGGDLTLTAGNGAGTGKNGIVRLSGGSGGTGGKGLVSLGTSGSGSTWTNDNTNPPTQYGPVCVTTAGIAQQCSAGALEGLVGICMDNCTNTGSSIVVSNQWARGTFDGATVTSGDYVSASTTPGMLTDVGPSPNTTAMTIGVVGSNINATDWNVFVFPQSPVVSLSNVVVTNPSGGNVILSASPTQTPLTLQAAATGTADIFLVKKFDGTTALKVDTNGILTVGTGAGTITSTQFVSATANPASNAANNILRLAKTDFVAWRNNGNSQDLLMGVNNSDFLSLDRMPGITINPNHGSFATTLTVTAPGQNQNLTIPDVGAATGTFVFQDFTQTLSKKTISDAVTFTNIATPPAPAAGFLKLYAKANQICTETSAAVEACGAGGGGATVTSVGQTVNGGATSGIFTLSGGPVTTSGTLDTAIAGTSGGVPYFSSATVLSSSAALTSNSPVLGGGAGATPKTIAGITSDGTSVITVGVAGSTVGGIDFKNATSGTISVRPTTGALGAVTWTIPAVTDTAVGLAATQTLTNKTLTLPVIASVSNSGTMTIPTGTDTLVGKATTDVFTNKTLDVEATGNSFTSTSKLYLAAGGCQNATASLLWDTPTTNPAVAACDTGTNVQKGIANFADGANTLSMSTNFLLPSDWSGAIDAKFRWFTTATTGNIVWQIATICVADGETSDPAYNTASTVTDAAKGTTLQDNDATITGVTTTGCAAGEMMYVKVFRDPTNGSDTLAATGSLRGLELTLRRTQ